MSRNSDDGSIIIAVDIGTSKVSCAIAEMSSRDPVSLRLIGLGQCVSNGLKKGVVVNIEATVQAIQQALKEAENMANISVSVVSAGITGSHIRGFNSHGMVAMKDREVKRSDIDRVIETARAVPIPADQDVLHILTQEFIVDGQSGVQEPLGMSGVRLEVNVHIVSGSISAAQNIIKCIRRCHLKITDLVLHPLASSKATLTPDEKDLGVCLIDIGAGTTDLMVFSSGSVRHTSVIPIAGNQVTNDIAIALHTPMADAEAIKCQYGCALRELVSDDEQISVPGIGDRAQRSFSTAVLASVIQPRLEELFELIRAELVYHGFEGVLSSGVVITGGTADMSGIEVLAERVFKVPVRVGHPRYTGPMEDQFCRPALSALYGLLLEEINHKADQMLPKKSSLTEFFSGIQNWVRENF